MIEESRRPNMQSLSVRNRHYITCLSLPAIILDSDSKVSFHQLQPYPVARRIGEFMKRIIALIFALTIPAAVVADTGKDVTQELKMLEGKWKAVGMEAAGKPFPKESVVDFTFTVAANGKATGKSAQEEYQATLTIDPKKSPRTIDNLHMTGMQKGKTQLGIYKLEGDKWTVCMTRPGVAERDRPRDFNTRNTANVVFVFERLKEDKKP